MPRGGKRKGAGRKAGSTRAAPTKGVRVTETAAEVIADYAESEGLTRVNAAHVLILAGRAAVRVCNQVDKLARKGKKNNE